MRPITSHPISWYSDDGWIDSLGQQRVPVNAQLIDTRVKGIRAWITPPWAIESCVEAKHLGVLCSELNVAQIPLIVCDLPSGLRGTWTNSWILQTRHTRSLHVDEATQKFPMMPKHRAKQARRGAKRGLRIEVEADINVLLGLHQKTRERKAIISDPNKLRGLLSWVLSSKHQSTYVVRDEKGSAIASATFLHDNGRTVYAFGGQVRSPLSALATVMLIEQGIIDAEIVGNGIFDFGGSSDPGVDRFYEEFGAEKCFRERAIHVAPWAKPWLKLFRPDLFKFN